MTQAELHRALSAVAIVPAYAAALRIGVEAGKAAWPDTHPEEQLRVARAAALKELGEQLGWAP